MRTRMLLGAALLAAGIVARPAPGLPGDPGWSDRFDRAGTDDRFRAVAAGGGRVFAVGDAAGDALVRSYDANTGKLLWQEFFDLAGGEDRANDVAVSGGRLFVVGSTESASGDADFLVRAYDARTGVLLWSDIFDSATQNDRAVAAAVHGRRLFVAGKLERFVEALTVRAYDVRTGALLWQNDYDPPGDFGAVASVGARGHRVVLVGAAEDAHDFQDEFLVHAIDEDSGETLWSDLVGGTGHDDDGALALALGPGRAFVTGWLDDGIDGEPSGPIGDDLLVRAYDLASGALVWEDLHDDPIGGRDIGQAAALAGRRLVVAGSASTGDVEDPNADLVVRCYDASDGELLWEDTADATGGSEDAQAIAVTSDAAVVVGQAVDALGAFGLFVRAYDLRTGAFLWGDVLGAEESTAGVATYRRGAFVTGAVPDVTQPTPTLQSDAWIQRYEVR